MKRESSTIPYNVYRPIYDFIDLKFKRYEFAREYGICNITSKMNMPFTTELMYNRLLEFQAKLLSDTNFSKFSHNGEFDILQLKEYYKALTDFINSDDFQEYTQTKKNSVIHEQNKIYKRIENYRLKEMIN